MLALDFTLLFFKQLGENVSALYLFFFCLRRFVSQRGLTGRSRYDWMVARWFSQDVPKKSGSIVEDRNGEACPFCSRQPRGAQGRSCRLSEAPQRREAFSRMLGALIPRARNIFRTSRTRVCHDVVEPAGTVADLGLPRRFAVSENGKRYAPKGPLLPLHH